MDEMRVVMVGKTGVGKSGVGNSLLKKKHFPSNTWAVSVTAKCKFGSRKLEDGTNLVIVDTPGIFDTAKGNTETSKEVVRCIGLSSPGPHAFFFVLKIGARFTQEEKNTIDCLKAIFGEQVVKFVIVIFTGKDNLEEEEISLEEYVSRAPAELVQLIADCSGCYAAINNRAKPDEKEKDIQGIFKAIRNTMERNGGEHYTGEMYEAAEEAFQEKLRLLEEEKHKKERQLDQKAKELEEYSENMKKKLDEDMAERRKALEEEQRQRDVQARLREEELARETERLNNLRLEEEQEQKRRREKMNQLAAEQDEERRRMLEDRDRDAKEREEERRQREKEREEERRAIEEERKRNEEERRRNEEERRRSEEEREKERRRFEKKLEEERLAKMKEIEEEREAERKKLQEERRKLDEVNSRNKVRNEVQDDDNFFVSAVKSVWNTITGWFS